MNGVETTSTRRAKKRLLVLTDFLKDPDDKQSLIRLLCYANHFDIEGLIATSLAYGTGEVHPEWIDEMIDGAYGAVRPSLIAHDRHYPTPEALRKVTVGGAPVVRKLVGRRKGFHTPPGFEDDSRSCEPAENHIGSGKDTPASVHIASVLSADDPRPVWITVWGGPMDLAQALWRLRDTLGAGSHALADVLRKTRLYQVSWQDTGAVWLWNEFPGLFRIQCDGGHRGMYCCGDSADRDQAWVDRHVKAGHGALGALYPKAGRTDGVKEGDTPSFLHLIPNGLSEPNDPTQGGWGGRFRASRADTFVFDEDDCPGASVAEERSNWTIGRWQRARQNDFGARMDRCVSGCADTNHNPVAVLNGDHTTDVLAASAKSGDTVTLSAAGSGDPDGDDISYSWWHYREAGTYKGEVRIEAPTSSGACLRAPAVAKPERVHIILEVTDNGVPQLTSYRRLILTVSPDADGR